jgi:ATP-dependent DNA ligase
MLCSFCLDGTRHRGASQAPRTPLPATEGPFDLIELNGDDLRRGPLEVREATLASIVAKAEREEEEEWGKKKWR